MSLKKSVPQGVNPWSVNQTMRDVIQPVEIVVLDRSHSASERVSEFTISGQIRTEIVV